MSVRLSEWLGECAKNNRERELVTIPNLKMHKFTGILLDANSEE